MDTVCALCLFCLNQLELNSCCPAQCALCRSSSCARDCVFMTRDMLRIMVQENLMCSSRPTWLRSLCLSMETLLRVLENRLRQTEEALVAERRASRRTAEVAQQVVRACPGGVDVEEIGDSTCSVEWSSQQYALSQWSLTVRRYFGEFNQTATRLDRRRGIVLAKKQPSVSEQDRRVRCLETRTPQTWCCRAEEKGDESAKP